MQVVPQNEIAGWLCAVVVYFLISISTRRWDITWIIFIIAGIGVSILDIGMDED